ncbi:glycoside hydrolase family 20 protein [Flavobacterium hiemivividum]|uniref:beta-N-acetylhexosaminidase n=1 Tax=Flavobacterium hiemivividum TaxID=2541734 RepID=A0A4R5CXF0_9FLAO|nr:glycoside hydrolase family 20 protein [Flavobacterium hiemivividum]TDE03254.1 beta-N-acetylhexosaminidase [Flavobacterium hiemivividum]
MKKIILAALLLPCLLLAQQKVSIIPQPVSIQIDKDSFIIDNTTTISFKKSDKDLKAVADFLSAGISKISGINLSQNKGKGKKIEFKISPTEGIGEEGYLLNVTPSEVRITANTNKGLIYGIQSLFQVLPQVRTNAILKIPSMQVKDYPRFKWRGMHLDVSRHFFTVDMVKEYIELLAYYKMNTFHWHLVDDQGWRIEIKKYPKLTEIGAWRVDQNDKIWAKRPQAKAGEEPTYGGYYTQEEIKEVVKFAAARGVNIVPEIEMPGHVASAIASYPELSCNQKFQLPLTGGDYTNMSSNYCPGNEDVFQFNEDILTEVMALFPSQYIHIGGDEVDKSSWKSCPKCQARMKTENLKTEEELQSYFIKRIEKFIVSKKRKMIGWDEILEGGLAPEAVVMSWRGEKGGIEAAKMHHEVVMTPGNPVYFDHYQAGPDGEPLAIGGMNTLRKVYDYEPIPKELPAENRKYILGAQANLWTEYITTNEGVEYMVLPRMLALAEVVWSPSAAKDWTSFNQRLKWHYRGFQQKGLHYSEGSNKIEITPKVENGQLTVALASEVVGSEIFYTLDGSDPNDNSIKYDAPFTIEKTASVRAVSVYEGKVANGIPSKLDFAIHKASGKNVSYLNKPSSAYKANGDNSLTDGVRGTFNVTKYWHGFYAKDMVATIDLGETTTVSKLALGCLQNKVDWIFFPTAVKFEISTDGINYKEVVQSELPLEKSVEPTAIHNFTTSFAAQKAKFVRITAKIIPALPKGHNGEGKPGWLFADEIVVE